MPATREDGYETGAPATELSFTFDRLTAVLLFLAVALGALLMPAQNDTWWQLRAGREMWATRHVLLHDVFSHTAAGVFWPNHEWLTQVLFYGVYAVGGVPLLTMVAALAVIAAWLLAWHMTRGSARVRFLLTAAALIPSVTIWSPRPQVLSLALLALTLQLVVSRRHVWLPVVFLLWANLHGAVVMGVLVLAAASVAAAVEDRRRAPVLAFTFLFCMVATLATPLGIAFWTEIPQSLARIRQLGIDEWAPPRMTSALLIPFWVMAAALASLLVVRGRAWLHASVAPPPGALTMCASALALLPLALTSERNVAPFLLLAVPAIASVIASQSESRMPETAPQRPRLNAAIGAAAGVLVVGVVAHAYRTPIDHMAWTPVPEQALAALRGCRGQLYNRYDEGGYLIWFAPEHPVFLDGRQDPYPVALIQEQVRVERTGDFADMFRRFDIHCAYVPADSLVSTRLVQAGWRSLFRDARWAVLAD